MHGQGRVDGAASRVILRNHQYEIDELIVQRQQMLAEGSRLTGAPPSPMRERPDVDLTDVNRSQDEWTRCMLVACEILQRGFRKAVGIPEHQEGAVSCVMSADYYDRVLKRLNHEQQDDHKRAVAEKARVERLLRAANLEPLVQNWPAPGLWSYPC